MVKEKLTSLVSTEWHHAEIVIKDIRKLKVEKLHKMESPETEAICHEVINAVEMNLLVSVEEWSLEERKLKKQKNAALKYSEQEIYRNGAKIRIDWASKEWVKHSLPHGWIYRDKAKKDKNWQHELLGTIYQTKEEKWYTAFIQREIADNPHGASLLISEMKKKLEKIIKNKKSHQ